MFTNNFYRLFRNLFLPSGNTLVTLTTESGTEYAPYIMMSSSYLPIVSSVFLTRENAYAEPIRFLATTDVTYKLPTVVVGSGNTPPNVNDIALESKITSGLSGSITTVGSAGEETGGLHIDDSADKYKRRRYYNQRNRIAWCCPQDFKCRFQSPFG